MGEGFGQEIQPDGDAIERARKCTSLPETTAGGRRGGREEEIRDWALELCDADTRG